MTIEERIEALEKELAEIKERLNKIHEILFDHSHIDGSVWDGS